MNSQPNSHTHCQAAQANAQTKAWQRVCLSQRLTKTTENRADEKESSRQRGISPLSLSQNRT